MVFYITVRCQVGFLLRIRIPRLMTVEFVDSVMAWWAGILWQVIGINDAWTRALTSPAAVCMTMWF